MKWVFLGAAQWFLNQSQKILGGIPSSICAFKGDVRIPPIPSSSAYFEGKSQECCCTKEFHLEPRSLRTLSLASSIEQSL